MLTRFRELYPGVREHGLIEIDTHYVDARPRSGNRDPTGAHADLEDRSARSLCEGDIEFDLAAAVGRVDDVVPLGPGS